MYEHEGLKTLREFFAMAREDGVRSFDEYQKSGRDGVYVWDGIGPLKGRWYAGDLFIEHMSDGWHFFIYNEEYVGTLEEMEKKAWETYLEEERYE